MNLIRIARHWWACIKDQWTCPRAHYLRDQEGERWAVVEVRAGLLWRIAVCPVVIPMYFLGACLCWLANAIAWGEWRWNDLLRRM